MKRIHIYDHLRSQFPLKRFVVWSDKYSYLTPIPLLWRLGFENYTFAGSFNTNFRIVDFEYLHYTELMDKLRSNAAMDSLCMMTYEEEELGLDLEGERHTRMRFSVSDVLPYCKLERIQQCAFLVDRKYFWPARSVRPLHEELNLPPPESYDEMFRKAEQSWKEIGYRFLVKNTRNIYFQECAIVLNHFSDVSVNRVEDLFLFDDITWFLPTWDWLIRFASPQQTQEKIENVIRVWFSSDRLSDYKRTLRKVSGRIFTALTEDFEFKSRNIEDKRRDLQRSCDTPIDYRDVMNMEFLNPYMEVV